MSTENPTIESLSEQFKAQRKDKLQERDEKTRSDLKDLFDRYETGAQRVEAIRKRLKSFARILSEEQKEYLHNSLEDVAGITDENEFVEKMLPVAKYYLDIQAGKLEQFEAIERQQMYDEHPTYRELNQLFAYELEDDEIHLHVPANKGTTIKDKLRLIDDGLKRLAEIVNDNTRIKQVVGRSWIVGENPKLLERLGFKVTDIETNPDGVKVGMATISRKELLDRYLKRKEPHKDGTL